MTTSNSMPVVVDGQQSPQAHRRCHHIHKPGSIGQLDINSLLALIDDIEEDKFAGTITQQWTHRYSDTVDIYAKDEESPATSQQRALIDYTVQAPSWNELSELLQRYNRPRLIHHLEVELSDNVRTVRIELGSPQGVEHRTSHRFSVETDEPEDGVLATSAIKLLHKFRVTARKKTTKTAALWLAPLLVVVFGVAQYIDAAHRNGFRGEAMLRQIGGPVSAGGFALLLVVGFGYARIRKTIACCVEGNWPTKAERARGTSEPLRRRIKNSLRAIRDALSKHSASIGALTAILAIILAVVALTK